MRYAGKVGSHNLSRKYLREQLRIVGGQGEIYKGKEMCGSMFRITEDCNVVYGL